MDSLIETLSINSQWKSFMHHSARHAKQGLIDRIDCGVDVYCTQCNWSCLNGLFLSFAVSDELDLRRRLENIKVHMKKMQTTFPWMLFIETQLIPPDVDERLQEICLASEFVHISRVKCMQTTKLLPPIRPLPNVEAKFASCEQDIYDAISLNLQAHNMVTSLAENVAEHRAFPSNFDKEFCCIVFVSGKPVSTATTLLLDKCLYAAYVATPVEYRKHGYAELALRVSIERALIMFPHTEHGVVLHATEMGRSVYARMGFKEISDLDMYVHKPSISIQSHRKVLK